MRVTSAACPTVCLQSAQQKALRQIQEKISTTWWSDSIIHFFLTLAQTEASNDISKYILP